jgi:large subunit ribosomal protein L17
MRHNRKINHLGRKSAHRKALLANMANSLILHKRINTTTAKAKALKVYVEPLITKAKNDTTHSRRVVFSYLKSKTAVSELFRDVAEKVGDRPGGYTRILKTGNRLGDNAEMCIIELVDFNENMLAAKETKTKSRRSRRGSSKKAETVAPVKAEAAKEAPKAEEAEEVQTVTEESVTDEPQVAEPEAEATEPEAEKEEPKAE